MPPSQDTACKIRRSNRAKRILLRVTPEDGLVATLPRRATRKDLDRALAEHAGWIERQLERVSEQRQRLISARQTRPEKLHFRAIDRDLRLNYKTSAGGRCRIIDDSDELHVHVPDINHIENIHLQLGQYVRRQARDILGQRLAYLAQCHDLHYSGLSVRRQKSRWGSCSARKRINLNDKLLFLPAHLMEHVLLHELAHTRHLNHSPRFHALLEKLDPQSRQHRRALRNADQYVPAWL
jgi:predicted metal-dependent hydrolase